MDRPSQLKLGPDVPIPPLVGFEPLPEEDVDFSVELLRLVERAHLDEVCDAKDHCEGHDEVSSICIVDLSDMGKPVVGGWRMLNFLYPAGGYCLYVLAEVIRQAVEDGLDLHQPAVVKARNLRRDTDLIEGNPYTLSDLLHRMCALGELSAANELIDSVNRLRICALLRSMGLRGSDVTRKFVIRELEDEGFDIVPSTYSCALHFATVLWAMEAGVIGGGRGRGMMKGYLSGSRTNQDRFAAGLPDTATLYSKGGKWKNCCMEAGLIEDGDKKYIAVVLAPYSAEEANPRIAQFISDLHKLMGS